MMERYAVDVRNARPALRCQHYAAPDFESCGQHFEETGLSNERNAAHVGCSECVTLLQGSRKRGQCQYLFGHNGQCWNGDYHFNPHKSCI